MRMYFFVVALSLIAGGYSFADETSTWLTHVRTGVRPTMVLEMNPERCALLIVDIQAMTMTDVATKNIEMSADDREFHRRRMHGTVLPNLNTLVTFFARSNCLSSTFASARNHLTGICRPRCQVKKC